MTLRPQLIVIAPLYDQIEADLAFSHTVGGLLRALPALPLGLFAPAVPLVAAKFDHLRATTWCILLIGVASLAREAAPGPGTVLVTTIGIGIGTAIVGSLLPVVVKSAIPHRPAAATGVYAGGIQLGGCGGCSRGRALGNRGRMARGTGLPRYRDVDLRWSVARPRGPQRGAGLDAARAAATA